MWNQTELETLVCLAGLETVPQRNVLHILNIFQLSREGERVHEGEEQKQILWPMGPPLSACACQRFTVSHGCVRNVSVVITHFAYRTTNSGLQESSLTEAKGSAVVTKLQRLPQNGPALERYDSPEELMNDLMQKLQSLQLCFSNLQVHGSFTGS